MGFGYPFLYQLISLADYGSEKSHLFGDKTGNKNGKVSHVVDYARIFIIYIPRILHGEARVRGHVHLSAFCT